jgi:chromosome segregation ATPase
METVDKETQKSWKTKAKEKSITIKALEKEKRRLQTQSQSYRETIKQLKFVIASLKADLTIKTDEIETVVRNVKKKKKALCI